MPSGGRGREHRRETGWARRRSESSRTLGLVNGWRPSCRIKESVKKLPFADAGLIGNPSRHPDNWVEVRKQQSLYWRVPTNQGYYK